MKNIIQWFLMAALSMMIFACGFHLRGSEPLPASLQTIYIQTNQPYNSFARELRQTLRTVGVTVAQNANTTPITLQILDDTLNQQITSVSTGGQTTTYVLNYAVNYQIVDRKGIVILAPQIASARRDYSATTNQLLGDINTQNTLINDMQREVIYQILNRLRTDTTLKKFQ